MALCNPILIFALFLVTCANSWVNPALKTTPNTFSFAKASSNGEGDVSPERPTLVLESTLLAAHEELYREIAKNQGIEYVNTDDEYTGYAIARLEVNVGIPPEIDLIETNQLVLINGVTQDSMDKGIRPLDTIVSVSCGDKFKSETLGLNLDETVIIIKEAMQYANQNGSKQIKFELNRLMRGKYKS